MSRQKKLRLNQLNLRLEAFSGMAEITVPAEGWLSNIRRSLGMTLEQVGKRLNISKQGVKNIEDREAKGSISINVLKDAARAMQMRLVYGFVPEHGSVLDLVDAKAYQLAQKIVLRTNQNMQLENQGIRDNRIAQAIKELAAEIKFEMRKSLWD